MKLSFKCLQCLLMKVLYILKRWTTLFTSIRKFYCLDKGVIHPKKWATLFTSRRKFCCLETYDTHQSKTPPLICVDFPRWNIMITYILFYAPFEIFCQSCWDVTTSGDVPQVFTFVWHTGSQCSVRIRSKHTNSYSNT